MILSVSNDRSRRVFLRLSFALLVGLAHHGAAPTWAWQFDHTGSWSGTGVWDRDAYSDVRVLPGGDIVAGGQVTDYNAATAGLIHSDNDWRLVRLDGATGAAEWMVDVSGGNVHGLTDRIEQVAVDASGDVFAAGFLGNAGDTGTRVAIAKFSGADGTNLWGVTLPLPPVAGYSDGYYAVTAGMEVDSAGDVIVGLVGSATGVEFRVVKIDGTSGGAPLWSFSVPAATNGQVSALAIDGNDDVVAVGSLSCGANCGNGFAAVKINGATGAEVWKVELATGANAYAANATDVALLGDGDAVVTGYSAATALVRLEAADGAVVWSVGAPTINGGDAVAIDGGTTAIVVVNEYDGATIHGADVSDGSVDWDEPVPASIGYSRFSDLVILSANRAAFSTTAPFLVTVASTVDGTTVWSELLDSSVQLDARTSALAVAADGDVVAVGRTTVDAGVTQRRGTVVKFDADDGALAECGNGATEDDEDCDDGNLVGGDCCAADCSYEATTSPCDDGQACSVSDQCNAVGHCTADTSGCTCGNGLTEPGLGEDCDDGNLFAGDCCSPTCEYEPAGTPCDDLSECTGDDSCNGAWSCVGAQPLCDCCSDHSGAGCAESSCQACICDVEPNCCVLWFHPICTGIAAGACRNSCVSCTCGDGILDPSEQCDDGNVDGGDCCDSGCQIETSCGDHLKCYKAATAKGTTKFVAQTVTMTDALSAAAPLQVTKPDSLCLPVDKNGEGIDDPAAHFECYKVKDDADGGNATIAVSNQFGLWQFIAGKAASLCMPSSRDGVPANLTGDALRCYKGKASELPRTVTLSDAFESKQTTVGKTALLCSAAAVDTGSIDQPERLSLCFKIKDLKTDPAQLKFVARNAQSQTIFGTEVLTAKKATLLCVPSLAAP